MRGKGKIFVRYDIRRIGSNTINANDNFRVAANDNLVVGNEGRQAA